jgi:HTH-type transcriptional regulator/antitoxin HigA
MPERINAEAFIPGEYIQEELEERGWTQLDLAEIMGRPPQAINEIIKGKKAITPETAVGLAGAFGTSAHLWLNLESAYQLSRVQEQDFAVTERARLYEIAPISQMQRRGWIESSSNVEVLHAQLVKFFGTKDLGQTVQLAHAARKSTDYATLTPSQMTWLCRAHRLAKAVHVGSKFSDQSFEVALKQLSSLKKDAEEIRRVPQVLAQNGIRFLVIEQLASTKIDGVCFWLDAKSPVVVLSLRYDRIDWFWHTLMHEMAHVKNRDGLEKPTLDTQLVGSDAQPFDQKPEAEKMADLFAVQFLIDQSTLKGFISRVHPLYSRIRILGFAQQQRVHPGIVVGQLQHMGMISYAHSRRMLQSVKAIVTASALTDGWGHLPQAV